jgi:hypothetical protein
MRDHEQAMLAYARLARVSDEKGQLPGRDRLLALAAAAACRAGWPQVAECCRRRVLEHNPRHVIGRGATAVDAMRDEEFQLVLKQLERMCPYEHAEHLAGALTDAAPAAVDAGRQALALLGCVEEGGIPQ